MKDGFVERVSGGVGARDFEIVTHGNHCISQSSAFGAQLHQADAQLAFTAPQYHIRYSHPSETQRSHLTSYTSSSHLKQHEINKASKTIEVPPPRKPAFQAHSTEQPRE